MLQRIGEFINFLLAVYIVSAVAFCITVVMCLP